MLKSCGQIKRGHKCNKSGRSELGCYDSQLSCSILGCTCTCFYMCRQLHSQAGQDVVHLPPQKLVALTVQVLSMRLMSPGFWGLFREAQR